MLPARKIRKLGQEERRPEIAHQPLVQEHAGVFRFADAREDLAVHGVVALAPARRDDELHPGFQGGVGLGLRRVERQPGGVDAELLPGLHLALVGLFRDLPVEVEGHGRVDRVGREPLRVEARRKPRPERVQMRLDPLARAGDQTQARNDDLAHQSVSARPSQRTLERTSPPSPGGNGIILKRISASQIGLASTAIRPLVAT